MINEPQYLWIYPILQKNVGFLNLGVTGSGLAKSVQEFRNSDAKGISCICSLLCLTKEKVKRH